MFFWLWQSKCKPLCCAIGGFMESISRQRWAERVRNGGRDWDKADLSFVILWFTAKAVLPNDHKRTRVHTHTHTLSHKLIPGTREFRTSNRIPFPWSWYHQILSHDLQPGNLSLSIDYPAIMGYNCSLPIPRTLKCCTENTLMHI